MINVDFLMQSKNQKLILVLILDQYQPITQHAHAVRHLNHSCIIIPFVYLFVYIISHVSALTLILKMSEQVAASETGPSSRAGCNEQGWTLLELALCVYDDIIV